MSGLAMLRMQVLVEQRIFWRNRSGMFFTFILPIALLLVLAISSDPVKNVPLIAALGILSTGFQGLAIQLAMHRDQGVLKRVMATPLPAGTLILGKVLSTMVVIALEVTIVIATGVLAFGAPFPHHLAIVVLFVLLGTGTFVSLGFAVASMIPTSESAPAITNAAYLGLILVTALLHQVDGMPDAISWIGNALPLTHLFVPVQHAWIGGWRTHDWWSAGVLAVWGALGATWTARRFRWEPAGER
jgi:ABC-2 type transport system permease protein